MGMTKGHGVASVTIGCLQLTLAAGVIISAFIFASYGVQAQSSPYWLGFGYILPGVFGIAGGITKNQCCMVTFLVLNIISTIVSSAASILVTIAWAIWNAGISTYRDSNCDTVDNTCICDGDTYNVENCDYLESVPAILVVLALFCYGTAILSLAGSIVGCMATCCAPPDQPTFIVAQQPCAPGVVISTSSTMATTGLPPYSQGAYGQQAPPAHMPTHDKAPLVV